MSPFPGMGCDMPGLVWRPTASLSRITTMPWPLCRLLLLCLPLLALAAADPATAPGVFSDAEWASSQPATPGPAAAAPTATAVVGSVAVSLVVVVGVAVGLGLLLKRLGVRRLVAGKGRHLEVVESVPVAFKRQVSLVRIGDQVVLVGVGEHELCHLGTLPASVLALPPAAAPAAPSPAVPAAPVAPSAFQQVLARLAKGGRP